MEYLLILAGGLVLGIILHYAFDVKLYQNWLQAALTTLIIFAVGVFGDSLAASRGYWIYPEENRITGWHIGILPIEEYLMLLIAPYLVLVIYRVCTRESKTN